MPKILFHQTQTLYAKVTIPLAIKCLDEGWDVTFNVNRPTFFGRSFGFSETAITRRPTMVGIMNPDAYAYVAGLAGYGERWARVKDRVNYSLLGPTLASRYDAVVSPTKNIGALRKVATKGNPAFVLAYQHLPIAGRVAKRGPLPESVFFGDNAFALEHKFSEIVSDCDVFLNTFPFLDEVYARRPASVEIKDQVLIFHPGGYRDVITAKGEGKEASHAKQKNFLKRLCLPVVDAGLKPVVKVHPLRAQFHDLADLQILVGELERENDLSPGTIGLIGPNDWFWDSAFKSAFIITFGSSSIYELWSAGLDNTFICNFEGRARSERFGFFESVFLNNYNDFIELTKDPSRQHPNLDSLTQDTFEAYKALFTGSAINSAFQLISNTIENHQ